MSERQLHLFDAARPLLQRFGAGFFRAVPPRPGVYIMGGEGDRVLYIGQSRNLRARLGSYKNARPDRAPRKVIRLIHCVRSIVWEECASAEAARLKENQLLRAHRPRFNRVNTYPRAYHFIALETLPGGLTFRLTTEPKSTGRMYGAFKSGCVRAYAALLRLLWCAANQPASPFELPIPLLQDRPPGEYCIHFDGARPSDLSPQLTGLVESYLTGESDALIQALTAAMPSDDNLTLFQRNFHAADLELLADFFERGPRRNRALRERHSLPESVIAQEALDDLMALADVAIMPRPKLASRGGKSHLQAERGEDGVEAGQTRISLPGNQTI